MGKYGASLHTPLPGQNWKDKKLDGVDWDHISVHHQEKAKESKLKEAVLQDHVEQQMEEYEDRLIQYALLIEAPYQ